MSAGMTPEQIAAARERCEKATPGPHQTRFIYRLLKAVRDNQELLGLMVEDDASMDWKDADLWAHAQEDITVALDAIAEKDVEITELKRQLAVTQYERDLCADGSPLARFAELYCGHDPLSGKPAELAVMERIGELERENERLKTHSTGLKCALEALRWSNHPEPCWCAVPEKDTHDDKCIAARSVLATP